MANTTTTNGSALASEKQVVLVTSLLQEREVPAEQAQIIHDALESETLTKKQASEWITKLFATPKKKVEITPGYYVKGEEVYKVVISKSSGQPYAKQMVVRNHKGSWEYAPGIVKELASLQVLTAQEAGIIGKKTGACMICGRTLTKGESIDAGIGPICAGKL